MTTTDIIAAAGLGVSIIALAQPWAISAWKKYLQRPRAQWYPHGWIEVGFSQVGPLLWLQGTLRTVHRDVFVETIEVEVRRLRDSATHTFEWLLFRHPAERVNEPNPMIQLAGATLVHPSAPRLMRVAFCDHETRDQIQRVLNEIQRDWVKEVSAMMEDLDRIMREQDREHASVPDIESARRAVWAQWNSTGRLLEPLRVLEQLNYWRAGEYELELSIVAESSRVEYAHQYRFSLSDEEARAMEINSFLSIALTCDRPEVAFSTATVQLDQANKASDPR